MRALWLIGFHLRIVVMNDLQYRANFVFQLIQSLVAMGTGLVVLWLILGQVDDLRGWSGPQLVVVLATFTIMGGVIRMVLTPNVVRFMEDVREGTLDYVLLKPVDAQLLVGIRAIELWRGVDLLTGGVLLVVATTQLDGGISLARALAYLLCLAIGAVIVYAFIMILASGAFLFVNVDPIIELFEGVYQAGRWPIGVYPGWLRLCLTLVVPIGAAITVPAEALTGRLSLVGLLGFAGLATAFLLLARWIWKVGLRHYSGASA